MNNKRTSTRFAGILSILIVGWFAFAADQGATSHVEAPFPTGRWIHLFNGRDLEGWIPKIRGYPLGENFGETFRVRDGILVVDYDRYGGKFLGRFGHLFYRTPFTNYILRVEYRFVGKQLPDGPGWAYMNSGIMFHCQPPWTMRIDQDFPVCVEVQLLGADGEHKRSTANVCTPGTHVEIGGKLVTQHCTSSTSAPFPGDQWVTVELEVHNHRLIRHWVNGVLVFTYRNPQLDLSDPDSRKLTEMGFGRILSSGYISLQSESHPVEFRTVAIKLVEP